MVFVPILVFEFVLVVEYEVSYRTIVSNTLIFRPASRKLNVSVIYIGTSGVKVSIAWQVSTRTFILVLSFLTWVILGSNSIFEGHPASLPAVPCPLYDVLNDWLNTWDGVSILNPLKF